jgi:predicted nucleotidyltransferase
MTIKPTGSDEYREVTYGSARWTKLKELREMAKPVMAALAFSHLNSVVHGSLARGDVKEGSDVDIFIAGVQSSFAVETALEKAGIRINSRLLVQATPNYAMKAHIEVNETVSASFPLMDMRRVEREFYRYGGEADLSKLQTDVRVAGVDKRLMLIEPTTTGHVESSIVGREESVAKLLGISAETVLDRVHALTRRDTVGRTGVFVKRELAPDETFEGVLKRLVEANPAVRRRTKTV